MPPSKGSFHWTWCELFGQRRLLGFGVVLAWLILFHLLVNVWLLCLFTSLLVVLGGWLGSRAALDTNNFLHLEHFLPLGKVSPPQNSPEQERRLDSEIRYAVHKAVQDFVSSWYHTLVPEVEGEFEQAVCNTMLESVMELKERARQVDRKTLVRRLLELYGYHLQSYMTVRQIQQTQKEHVSLWQLYCKVDSPHPALSSATAELNYSRALVNLVLHVLVPYPHMETRTGGYMVTELITCNVLLPLINRISEPDWLNQTIVDIFTRSRELQEFSVDEADQLTLYKCNIQQESWTTCQSTSFCDQADVSSKSSSEVDFPDSQSAVSGSESSLNSMISLTSEGENCSKTLSMSCKVNCCLLTSGQYAHSSSSIIVSTDSLIRSESEEDLAARGCDCVSPANLCNLLPVKDEEACGCFGPLRNLGPKVIEPRDTQWPAGIAQDKSPACSRRKLCLPPYNSPPATLIIQNVHISGMVTVKEQRSTGTHPYTLYTVKFETLVDGNNTGAVQSAVRHTVNRRYSEFLNLQARLEDKPEIKKLIKNVKGPKRIFPDLPFSSPDAEKVETRKNQLDFFLKQLSSIPDTVNCEDMQEFLAINSDVCTYFGRKPSNKSRIDKIMENALDTLRTALPHPDLLTPTDDLEADADGRTLDNRKYRRLFPSKVSPSLTIPDVHPKVAYCFSESSTVLNGMSLSGLESFVIEQERLLCCPNVKEKSKPRDFHESKDKKIGKSHGTDTAVADVALNILCLLMKDQWSWLCTENVQKAIRLLFGTFIERWLDVGAAHLTSASCWLIYLQVLREAVWPGGTLPTQPRTERSTTEKDETKQRCLDCLMQLLPELITDMLGSDKYRLSLETMLESVQDHQINKHLIYCMCDLLLELLIPESCDELFQTSLIRSLVKDMERDGLQL